MGLVIAKHPTLNILHTKKSNEFIYRNVSESIKIPNSHTLHSEQPMKISTNTIDGEGIVHLNISSVCFTLPTVYACERTCLLLLMVL